jgi:hypothetical protein
MVMWWVFGVVVFLWMMKVSLSSSPKNKFPSYGNFDLRIAESTCIKGERGVFATKSFSKGDVVERCPCVTVPASLKLARLSDYTYDAGKGKQAVAFGYGSIYNHSKNPHIEFNYNARTKTLTMKAIRDISPGEEIFTSYGDKWWKDRKGVMSC